ncbi:MAG: DDE-type integrase/transposase/recombinase [Actinomycetota bacterium]|nr:DDE-type integrase/transposase/recombinase [Actinomycetota bacterium]
MATRHEITKKYAREYGGASKLGKGRMLDELVAVTGWSRANARRAIGTASRRRGPVRAVRRKRRAPTYGYDTLKVLIQVWTLVGEPCGKYLAPIMAQSLAQLEGFGELDQVSDRLTEEVRAQLVVMSPATIDRMLAPTRTARYPAAKSATRPSVTLRSSIGVRQGMDAMEQAPGFFEIDLVAHCGHTLKGEHAWTLTATDVFTGWTENVAIRNRAHTHVVAAIEAVRTRLPYPMVGLDCDNGGEFINHALVTWCAERTIFMTRARAHTSNDNAHVEQKNGDIVRRSAFRYRYDTPQELALLNELWGHVNLRKNLFLPTKKANGWRTTKAGRNTRTYDAPKTPYQRLRTIGILGNQEAERLHALHTSTNPAVLTRNINRIQQALIASAKDKTLALRDQVS